MRIYLENTYKERDEVKALGAWYDVDQKKWYIEDRHERALFERWIPIPRERVLSSHLCNAPGCGAPGSMSHPTDGSGPWVCSRHFFNHSQALGDMSPAQRKENLQDLSRLLRNFSQLTPA
jgi:hypothetical protein